VQQRTAALEGEYEDLQSYFTKDPRVCVLLRILNSKLADTILNSDHFLAWLIQGLLVSIASIHADISASAFFS